MPYWVKQYRDTKGLNLISSIALENEPSSTSTAGSNSGLSLQLTWKQFENPLSFVPSPVSATISNTISNNNGEQQDERYVVILTSNNDKKTFNPYKLYSSKHKNKAEEALSTLHTVLQHLITIQLSLELLSLLILPIPRPVEDLPYIISQYALKLPPASIEWQPLAKLVINELPLAYCMCEIANMAILKTLHETPDINLAICHPRTGATLVHMAASTSDDLVREIIDYLQSRLDREAYLEHINKPCSEEESSPGSSFRQASLSSTSLRVKAKLVTEESLLSVEKMLRRNGRNSPIDPTPSLSYSTATPLMRAVKRNCVRSVNYLLVIGASTDYQDPTSGLTALHIAAWQSNLYIIKLLLSFEADLTVTDNEGRTPIDLVKKNEALECVQVMETVQELRQERDLSRQHKTDSSTTSNIPLDSVTLLTIDGGGTRGCICSYSLYYIEQRMRSLSNDPNLHIRQYFNWFSGTSIGAFFVLCMTHAHLDMPTLMSTVVNNRFIALAGKRLYDAPTQETFLHKYIGNVGIKDISEPKVLILTARADLDPPRLVHISNYREDSGDGREWRAWQAARASGAAPTFFPSYERKYVDGGILATNPTQHALHDIHVYDGKKVGLVLSLGTGVFQPSPNETIDLVKPRLTHLVSDLQNDIKFLKSLKCMLTANIVNSEDTVSHSKCWCESQGGVFQRLSPPLTQRYELDEKSDESFVMFFYETYLYFLSIDGQISDIAEQLLSSGPRWTEEKPSSSSISNSKPLYKSTWV